MRVEEQIASYERSASPRVQALLGDSIHPPFMGRGAGRHLRKAQLPGRPAAPHSFEQRSQRPD